VPVATGSEDVPQISSTVAQIKKSPLSQMTHNSAQSPVTPMSAGRTTMTKSGKLTSPGRMPGSSATKRPPLASPGHAPAVSQKGTDTPSRTPAAKANVPTSPGRVTVSAAKRHPSASPARVAGTPASQKTAVGGVRTPSTKAAAAVSPGRVAATGSLSTKRAQPATQTRGQGTVTSQKGTPTTKPSMSASPGGRLVTASAGKRRQSASPGRVCNADNSSAAASRTPAVKAGISPSPGRAVSSPAAKRVESASAGRMIGTASLKTTEPSRTPSVKSGTSASLGHVVIGTVVAHVQSASPGRTPASQKNTGGVFRAAAGKAVLTSASRVGSGSSATAVQPASPGRVLSTPVTGTTSVHHASRTQATKPSPSRSTGQTSDGSAAKRPVAASPARVAGIPTTQTLSRVVTGSSVKRRKSASPGRVPKTPVTKTTTDSAKQTPASKPNVSASPGRVVTGSYVKRRKSASPGRVPKTPVAETTTDDATPASARKRNSSASASRVVTVSAEKRQKSAASLSAASLPRHVCDTSAVTETAIDVSLTSRSRSSTSASPRRAVTDAAVKRRQSASVGCVPKTPVTEKTVDDASETGTNKPASASPSPGRTVTGSAIKRQKSASAGRVPETAQTPANKPGTSASPDWAASSSSAKRRKSASAGRVPKTPLTQTTIDDSLQTPASQSGTAVSPGAVDTGSAAKRQKSASPARATGSPATKASPSGTTDRTMSSAARKRQKSASPGQHQSRRSSASPIRHSDAPVSQESTSVMTDAAEAGAAAAAAASPSPQRGRSVNRRRALSITGRASGTPSTLKSSARRASRTPAARPSTPKKPSPRRIGSATKRRDSTSPAARADSTPSTERSSARRGSRTPATKRAASASPGQQTSPAHAGDVPVSSSVPKTKGSASKRPKSASAGDDLTTTAVVSATGTGDNRSASPRQRRSGSAAKRRRSVSPALVSGTPVTQKSSASRKSGSARRGAVSPSHSLPAKRGIKRSGGSLEEPPRKQLGVSFGPDMSPELFDRRLPPITPVKRGATPQRMSAAYDALRPALKGRHSAIGSTVVEDTEYATVHINSAKTTKSAKRRSKSAQVNAVILEQNVGETVPSVQKSASKGRRSSGLAAAEDTEDVEVSLQTPKTAKRRSQSAERGVDKFVSGSKKNAKKRSKSLSAVDDLESDAEKVTTKETSAKRSRSVIGSRESMAGGERKNKSPVRVAAAVTASPVRAKSTPDKPFRYRSPTLETGSIKVRGSKKIVVPSAKRARSFSPVKVVTEQPLSASPTIIKRTPQKPFRYQSPPTLDNGSAKGKGSRKTGSPSAKHAQSLSVDSTEATVTVDNLPAQTFQTPSGNDSAVGKKGKPTAVQAEKSPVSAKHDKSSKVLHLTPTPLPESQQRSPIVAKSKDVSTTPVSAKKRKSPAASGQKGNKSPSISSVLASTSKESPRTHLHKISLSPAGGNRQKSSSGRKTLDKVATEVATSGSLMTPGRMVAMRAVFGQEMTPKLKMPNDQLSSSQTKMASLAASGGKKRGTSPKSVAKRSAGKVSSVKSVRKSAAKKTLWSEVVKRPAAAPRKSGPKIIKPVVVKARKMKGALTAVVSILT